MTNLEKLKEIVKNNNGIELYNWLEYFLHWINPETYFDETDYMKFTQEEYKESQLAKVRRIRKMQKSHILVEIAYWILIACISFGIGFMCARLIDSKPMNNAKEINSDPEFSTYRIKIYNYNGEALQEYVNNCNIEYDRDYIFIVDENGRKHTIYNPTGIVIIDEISDSNEKKSTKQAKELIASTIISYN